MYPVPVSLLSSCPLACAAGLIYPRHGPHRTHCIRDVQCCVTILHQFLDCCARILCSGNVFAQPFLSSGRHLWFYSFGFQTYVAIHIVKQGLWLVTQLPCSGQDAITSTALMSSLASLDAPWSHEMNSAIASWPRNDFTCFKKYHIEIIGNSKPIINAIDFEFKPNQTVFNIVTCGHLLFFFFICREREPHIRRV